MRILIAYDSLSGNTRDLARMVRARCEERGHAVTWVEAGIQTLADSCAEPRHDLYLLGSWTDNGGRTPTAMKRFIAELVEAVGKPERLAVFGTGETQWGEEYYCGAPRRMAGFFGSRHPPLEIEQMPHGRRDALKIDGWTDQVLATAAGAHVPSTAGAGIDADRCTRPRTETPSMLILHASTTEDVNAAIAAHPRLLVDYYKDDCPGCRMLDMSLRTFAAGPTGAGLVLLKVKLETVGEAFFRELGLRQTPTLALHVDGREVAHLPGYRTPAQIAQAVQAHVAGTGA